MRPELWFDVGIETYTTADETHRHRCKLWFDVGIETYTTFNEQVLTLSGCGLM